VLAPTTGAVLVVVAILVIGRLSLRPLPPPMFEAADFIMGFECCCCPDVIEMWDLGDGSCDCEEWTLFETRSTDNLGDRFGDAGMHVKSEPANATSKYFVCPLCSARQILSNESSIVTSSSLSSSSSSSMKFSRPMMMLMFGK
jgi:hypothetical protein